MNDSQYTILAYAVGLGLLWGYAGVLWISARRRRCEAFVEPVVEKVDPWGDLGGTP